ncbi:hypothetical protein DNTS_014548 [Danionella cerebrum]|uniref:Uncharacterized protein n=1 Tax=Danionella cerebrum TaxID=2873325 RepID=A0A553RLU8_9TELE|nr:hypothetical protein DNTS_014548 [Danionella translucida]
MSAFWGRSWRAAEGRGRGDGREDGDEDEDERAPRDRRLGMDQCKSPFACVHWRGEHRVLVRAAALSESHRNREGEREREMMMMERGGGGDGECLDAVLMLKGSARRRSLFSC